MQICLSKFICTRTHSDGLMGHGPRLRNADNDIRWTDLQMSFSVIGRGTNWKLVYELLLVVLWLRYSVEPALVYIASDEALKLLWNIVLQPVNFAYAVIFL